MNLPNELVQQFRRNIQTYSIILALVVIWGLFGFLSDGAYLQPQNFSNLFRQMTVTSFLAIGMVLVIVTGNIDLSVGKAAGFISVMVAHHQYRVWHALIPGEALLAAILSISLGILLGILWGVIQGYVISYQGIPAFIVTLGGLFIMRGAILLRTEGRTIPANQPYLSTIAQGYLDQNISWIIAGVVIIFLFFNMFRSRKKKREYGFELSSFAMDLSMTIFFSLLMGLYVFVVNKYQGIQIPVMLLAIAAVILAYVSNNSRFGRYAYAIGGNREAARLSGINIRKNVFQVFVLMGLLTGIGGVVLASYVGYGTIAAGEGYELDAIAAAILGGTSPLGGEGTIFGALVGALIMSSLTNGLQIMNVAPGWTQLVKGLVLVLAVFADARLKRNR